MKLKPVVGLVLLLLVALAVVGPGCVAATGGGWFVNEADGALVTFGFNAQPIDDGPNTARGQFQLVDHGTRPPTRIHGEFTATYSNAIVGYQGMCSIDGEDGHSFLVSIVEEGDGPKLVLYLDGEVDPAYKGVLGGGTIRGHER